MIPYDYRPPIVEDLSQVRRKMAAASPHSFARLYLRHHTKVAPSRMHLELYKLLQEASAVRQQRIAIAAPRGHAKTTIVSLAYVLWSVLYKKEKFVLLVSATREQAVQLLKTIRDELQTNPLLISDFPESCNPPGRKPAPTPWKEHQIVLPNGSAIRALGANQALRGMKHNQHRPSLIIADDLENTEIVIVEEQRDKLRRWFRGTLMKAGEPSTNVVVIGTVLHHDSLLAGLTNPDSNTGWIARRYKAVEQESDRQDLWDQWASIYRERDDYEGESGPDAAKGFFEASRVAMLAGTRVLWPEWEDYYDLMVLRECEGRASFQAEKQNEPLDPDECIFAESRLHFWDEEFEDEQALLEAHPGAYFYGACDPSLGRSKKRGDYTAIVILLQTKKGINYVIVADIARRSPDQTVQRILQYAKMYRMRYFVVETNQFQDLLAQNLEKAARAAGVSLRLTKLNSSANKQARISALEPYVNQGRLRFTKRHPLLLDQLRVFPLGVHDDGPDALEMACQKALRPRSGGSRQI